MDTKCCTKCKITKEISEFHAKKTERRVSSWCKVCLHDLQKQRCLDRKRQAIQLLGGKCCDCGYNKNHAALEFHHLDPKVKSEDWKRLRSKSWPTVVAELSKCVLLCRNCHAERHWPDCQLTGETAKANVQLSTTIQPTGVCENCDEPVFGTRFCSHTCTQLSRRKATRPGREELADLLEKNSYTAVAKMHHVSDNAVRKWAKLYGLL